MAKRFRYYFNWSSGKDASLALYYLRKKAVQIQCLLTTINEHHDRVSMHGLRRKLLEQQANAIGIPLELVGLPQQPDMDTYAQLMEQQVSGLQGQGYTHAAFGDIFLEDLRSYRENQLSTFNIQCVFPLWGRDTRELLKEFIELGFKAIVLCIDAQKLDASFLGREIDPQFLIDLPMDVDPCGENGEFHTFCYDGPIFDQPVPFEMGERVYREYPNPNGEAGSLGFWFLDLLPKT